MDSKSSFERLLNHKCDIYHHQSIKSDIGYGLISVKDDYPEKADLNDVKCHVHRESLNVAQNEPNSKIVARRKIDFPIGTDIRLNDMVVFDGLKYFAEVPHNIRDHHITVYIQRKDKEAYI